MENEKTREEITRLRRAMQYGLTTLQQRVVELAAVAETLADALEDDGSPPYRPPCPECGIGAGLHLSDCSRAREEAPPL